MQELPHTEKVRVQSVKRTISLCVTTACPVAALLLATKGAQNIIIIALLITAIIESSRWESANRQLAELHKAGQGTSGADSNPNTG